MAGVGVGALGGEIDESVLEEGCYYLSELGMQTEEIASHFELEPSKVRSFVSSYASRVKSGEVAVDAFDKAFWEGVVKEAEGDVKLTFISEKGFHHAWKSELRKLDGTALMSIFEASKDFLNSDPNQRFLDYAAPKGYDPLALEREVRKALEVVGKLMEEKFKEGNSRPDGGREQTQS